MFCYRKEILTISQLTETLRQNRHVIAQTVVFDIEFFGTGYHFRGEGAVRIGISGTQHPVQKLRSGALSSRADSHPALTAQQHVEDVSDKLSLLFHKPDV